MSLDVKVCGCRPHDGGAARTGGGVENIKIDKSLIFGWHAQPQLADTARLRPMGFGAAAFTRFASEGWWACLDSNQEPDRYERPVMFGPAKTDHFISCSNFRASPNNA